MVTKPSHEYWNVHDTSLVVTARRLNFQGFETLLSSPLVVGGTNLERRLFSSFLNAYDFLLGMSPSTCSWINLNMAVWLLWYLRLNAKCTAIKVISALQAEGVSHSTTISLSTTINHWCDEGSWMSSPPVKHTNCGSLDCSVFRKSSGLLPCCWKE